MNFISNANISAVLRVIFLLACVFCPPLALAQTSSDLVILDARLFGDTQQTRFVIDLNREVTPKLLYLSDPDRIVIELPEAEYRLNDDAGIDGQGIISQFRYGLFFGGNSRFILDLSEPASVVDLKLVPLRSGRPAHIALDLEPVSRDRYSELVTQTSQKIRNSQVEETVLVEQDDEFIVVIDAGHGGVDGGALGKNGTKEKTVVLQAAKDMKAALERMQGVKVHLTRDRDVFIPLNTRVLIARKQKADLFVSLHADAFQQANVRGSTIYTVSDRASDQDAARFAANENRSDILGGAELESQPDTVSSFLIDLMVRESRAFSSFFAENALRGLGQVTKLHSKKPRSAAFRVLRAPDIPSVLIELGYISNPTDESLLNSAEWRQKVAQSLARDIVNYGKATGHLPN